MKGSWLEQVNKACETYSTKEDFAGAYRCYGQISPAHTTASIILGSSRIQKRTRSTKNKLEKHCTVTKNLQKMDLNWEEEAASLSQGRPSPKANDAYPPFPHYFLPSPTHSSPPLRSRPLKSS